MFGGIANLGTEVSNTDEYVIINDENFFEFVRSMAQLRDEILLKKLVEKIKKLREQRGISQEKFYNDTNINIARIESVKANMTISTLSAICKYLNVTTSDLLKGL